MIKPHIFFLKLPQLKNSLLGLKKVRTTPLKIKCRDRRKQKIKVALYEYTLKPDPNPQNSTFEPSKIHP